jgi:predicted AAA+ superfamily ATPase
MPTTRARYLEPSVAADLASKMVLVAGPRQIGKTTLARRLLEERGGGLYLTWDNRDDRGEIRAARWPGGGGLVVLDELHKWKGWKRWLKGEFDKHRDRVRFLVTGSARMDLYRRGGDSLQGRYHHYRLHPFSLGEIARRDQPPPTIEPGAEVVPLDRRHLADLADLMERGGFPEPLLSGSARTHRRWQKERLDRFFREDVRDLEAVRDLSSLQLLADLLPDRVGSPFSLNALREDLEVSHRAVSHWMDVLERLYHVVRVRPWSSPRIRSLRKMPKVYLWDWSLVPGRGPRFENVVALHLLKLCHFLEDAEGHATALWYLRDRAGHEVDFLVTVGRTPWMAVEAKVSETRIDPALVHFKERLALKRCYQVVLEGERDFVQDGVRCLPADRFLAALV